MTRRWTAGRIGAAVAGVTLAVVAALAATAGGVVLAMFGDGTADLGSGRLDSEAQVVVTGDVNWADDLFGILHDVRFSVEAEPGALLVGGVVAEQDVAGVLGEPAVVVEPEDSGFQTRYAGYLDPQAWQAVEDLRWRAEASGTGEAVLEFSAREQPGRTVMVLASSEPLTGVTVDTSATVPALPTVGVVFLVGGLLLLVPAVFLVLVPVRRARRRETGE